ncbi:hypothetical protein [Streptomyces sp. NPDC087525]|uniref:hypothetical protein n=1 Tax=Streptomyces sp. NPDC087525 TaxID=3365793 RepID=UPI00382FC83B
MSARDALHSDLLTTPTADTVPHPEGWASIRIERYRDEVRAETLAEAKAEIVAWLDKKAQEDTPVWQLASKVDRGAVRIFLGTGHFRDAMDAHRAEERADVATELENEIQFVGGPDSEPGRVLQYLADRLRRTDAGSEEKASAPAPTATPVQLNVPDGEIAFVGFTPITLTGWNVIELAPDYYGNTYMQIGGWLPEGHPTVLTPVGTAQMTYAHLHGHAIPRDLNVQVETKGYGGPRRFMNIQWRKDSVPSPTATSQPKRGRARLDATSAANGEASHWRRLGVKAPTRSGEWAPAGALRDRIADLLTHIRRHPGRTWTTEDVRKFYLSQAPKRATCRRDLAALHAMGWLVEHDEPGRRFYRLNPQKDGQR